MNEGRRHVGRPFCLAVLIAIIASSAHAVEEIATVEELVERGFQIVAQGELLEADVSTCLTLRVNGERGNRCSAQQPVYGRFRRLAKGDEGFVCVSFRNWTCFRSEVAEAAPVAEAPAP